MDRYEILKVDAQPSTTKVVEKFTFDPENYFSTCTMPMSYFHSSTDAQSTFAKWKHLPVQRHFIGSITVTVVTDNSRTCPVCTTVSTQNRPPEPKEESKPKPNHKTWSKEYKRQNRFLFGHRGNDY